MRRCLFVLLLGFQWAWGQLAWEQRDLELPAAPGDTNVVARFVFENTGPYPIVIRSVQSTCGCTAIAQDKKVYPPGEKGEILANFGFGQRVGLQKRYVLVHSDDRTEPTARLSFAVRIPDLVRVTPSFVYWLAGDAAEPKTIRLQIGPDAPVHIQGVESNHATLPVRLRTVREGAEYEITVTPASTAKPCLAVLRIRTDFPKEKPRTFLAYAMVKERGGTAFASPGSAKH